MARDTQFILALRDSQATGRILCKDGEWHASSLVGPGGYAPKTWFTRKGADKAAERAGNSTRFPVTVVELFQGVRVGA